ncbi:MAG: ABC transporter permease subunit [Anaeromyxobacteraceae bacterium]
MTWKLARTVFWKELRDGLRDRRTLSMALIFPLMGPLVMAGSFSLVTKDVKSAIEDAVKLPVVNPERAPQLVAFLREGGLDPVAPPAEPEKAVRAGDVDVVLAIPETFAENLREGKPAPVRLYVDESRRAAKVTADRLEDRLELWGRLTGAQRLIMRGVHPAVVEPLAIEKVDVSTAESRAAMLFSVMPYFLVLAIFIGGMSTAIDMTAGERERLSLEPLLANPVPRQALVLGKIATSSTFSLIALAETSVGFALLPVIAPIETLGLSFKLDPAVVLQLFLLCIPLLLAANALMVVVAARARSFRAAQSTMSFLMLVPAIPGFVLAMTPVKEKLWMKLTPALGEQLVMVRLLRGEQVAFQDAAMAMAASLVLAIVLVRVASRLFEGGKLLFDKA